MRAGVKEDILHRPSRREVATAAGVSEATVSRVFNNPARVSREKVRRVKEAVRRLGYRPDKHASALRRRGTGTVLFLEYTGGGEYHWPEIRFFNWLYADILRAVVDSIGQTLFHLELKTVASLNEIAMVKGECDGILAFNVEEARYAEAVAATGIPYVCAHHTESLEGYSRCSSDNRAGGGLLGSLVREAGILRSAYVTGHTGTVEAHRRRFEGFCETFRGEVSVIETPVGIEGGIVAARELAPEVRRGSVQGICVVNDLTAIGVIRGLTAAGLKVPDQCVVAGYDNLPVGLGLPYTIPTVDLRLDLLYREAVAGLLRFIGSGEPADLRVTPELVAGFLAAEAAD